MVIPIDPTKSYITKELVEKYIVLDDDVHHAPTRLVCLENTGNGRIFPLDEQKRISEFAKMNGVKMHLDGARIWNASVATNTSIKALCMPFDTVSLCFSKGLGAPVGSVLVGPKDLIRKARHFRKLYGGGMRQAGILAAGCLYALENHFPKLDVDHKNAQYLSTELQRLGFKLFRPTETNMVWADVKDLGFDAEMVSSYLGGFGIRTLGAKNETVMRFVVHHQNTRESIDKTLSLLKYFVEQNSGLKAKL